MSASVACPSAYASTPTRTRPVSRDSSVPSATTELDRTSREAAEGSTSAVLTFPRARRARRVRRKWFPHQSARIKRAGGEGGAAPLNTAERTETRVGAPMRRLPSADANVTVIANVPDTRFYREAFGALASAGSERIRSAPSGNVSFSLARWTCTVTGLPVPLTKPSGMSALRAVTVTRRPVVETLPCCRVAVAFEITARFSRVFGRNSRCSTRGGAPVRRARRPHPVVRPSCAARTAARDLRVLRGRDR